MACTKQELMYVSAGDLEIFLFIVETQLAFTWTPLRG